MDEHSEYKGEPPHPSIIQELVGAESEQSDISKELKDEISKGGVKVSGLEKKIEESDYFTDRPTRDYAERLLDGMKGPSSYYDANRTRELSPGQRDRDVQSIEDALSSAKKDFQQGIDSRVAALEAIKPFLDKSSEDTRKQIDYLLSLDPQKASEVVSVFMDWKYPRKMTDEQARHRYQVIITTLNESGSARDSLHDLRRLIDVVNDAVSGNEQKNVRGRIPADIVSRAMRQPQKYDVEVDEKGHRVIQEKITPGIESEIDPFNPKDGLSKKIHEKFESEKQHLEEKKQQELESKLSPQDEDAIKDTLVHELGLVGEREKAALFDWYRGRLTQEAKFTRTISTLRNVLGDKANGYNDRGLFETFIAPLAQNQLQLASLTRSMNLAEDFLEKQPDSVLQAIATGELYSEESFDILRTLSGLQDRIGKGLTITQDADNVYFTIDMGKDPFDNQLKYKDETLMQVGLQLSSYEAHNHFLFDVVSEGEGKLKYSVKKLIA